MKVHLARATARALVLAASLLPAIEAGQVAAQVADEDAFRSFIEGVQDGTLPSALAVRECQRELAAQAGADSVRQMMAGYLEVPERMALGAFCESLVRAAEAGDVAAETAGTLGRHQMDADFFHAFGRLLRAVHFAHHVKGIESVTEDSKP